MADLIDKNTELFLQYYSIFILLLSVVPFIFVNNDMQSVCRKIALLSFSMQAFAFGNSFRMIDNITNIDYAFMLFSTAMFIIQNYLININSNNSLRLAILSVNVTSFVFSFIVMKGG
jgi:hypothetical protein